MKAVTFNVQLGLTLLISGVTGYAFAQPVKDSLDHYLAILEVRPDDITALYKTAEYSVYTGGRAIHVSGKKRHYDQAMSCANTCKDLYPQCWQTYFALSLAYGAGQQISKDIHFKRTCSVNIKSWIDQALKLHPGHAESWSVLGMWHYRMVHLGVVESLFAGGSKKDASLGEAQYCLQRAIQLNRHEPRFYLMLGIIYQALNLKEEARSHLLHAMEQAGEGDPFFTKKCKEQLSKL